MPCGCQDEPQEKKSEFIWTMDPEKKYSNGIANLPYHPSNVSINRLNEENSKPKDESKQNGTIFTISNGTVNQSYRSDDPEKFELSEITNSVNGNKNSDELYWNAGPELIDVCDNKEWPNSRFRSTLSQCVAVGARNLLLLDFGMVDFYPVILIPALTNSQQGLTISNSEASWLGSLSSICQPLGCILAAFVLEPLGRKYTMMLLNIPFLAAWIALLYANTVNELFIITIIQGIGLGAVEATMLSYVSEVSEPKLRGMLVSIDDVVEYIGYILILFLGSFMDWRTAAAVSTIVPILSLIAMYQIPETPIWLLSRGRVEEAEKALCWLRGWVSPEQVRKEFLQIVKYSCSLKTSQNSSNSKSSKSSFTSIMFRREMMRPLLLVTCFFFFASASGLVPVRPYLITVCSNHGILLDPYVATLVCTGLTLSGCILCTFLLGLVGKRPLAIGSISGCAISCFVLSICGIFEKQVSPWILVSAFFTLSFFSGLGMIPLPWIYMSEVFPFRGRNIASGIGAAVSHLFTFIVNLFYLDMEIYMSFSGVFFLYGVIAVIGIIYFYTCLPETEGCTMEEIEDMFKKR